MIGGDTVNIFDIANAFLSIGPQTHKKLQKLCYYAYAWYLAQMDERLFEESFEAWVHGPVCPELYNYIRHDCHYVGDWAVVPQYTGTVNADAKSIAEWVYEAYGEFSGTDLEMMTHHEDPWIKARGGIKPWERSNTVISDEDIKEYYRKQMN